MDAHSKRIRVAQVNRAGDGFDWECEIPTTEKAVARLARKLRRGAPGEVHCCYEAGPVGYKLARWLEREEGVYCAVIAPSLIPKRSGDRVKTDRRDARKLGQLYRAGMLTVVRPPTEEEEAARDLYRCREAARDDLHRARQRLGKYLRQCGFEWSGTNWTQKHLAWIRGLRPGLENQQTALSSYLRTYESSAQRLAELDRALHELAESEPYRTPVGWLRCFRGIDTLTAIGLLVELHGIERFQRARELMSYLGLTPSEYSSADQVRRGGITKTGNQRARRLVTEMSWNQRYPKNVSAALKKRRKGQPDWVIELADKAMQRLHRRFQRLTRRGKDSRIVAVAVAREAAGFIWAVLQRQPLSDRVARPE
jgi:transposase